MKLAKFVFAAAALGSSTCVQAQVVDTMAQCRKDTAAYLDAYNRGETAALAAMYEKDATFSSPFWSADGRDAIAQGFKAEMAGGTKFTKIGCAHSSRIGQLGYADGPWSATTKGPDGKPMTVGGHYVVVVKMEQGKSKFLTHINNFELPPPGAPATH